MKPLLLMALLAASTCLAALQPGHLRCEYRVDPAGVDVAQPRLSWTSQTDAATRGVTQSAYQILAATTPEKLAHDESDLWDTGKIPSDQDIQIPYAGKALTSRARVWWKARVWDQDGHPGAWSAPATWTMGLLAPSDWQAKWIGDPGLATNHQAPGPLNGYHTEIANSADTLKWVGVDLGQSRTFEALRLFPARPYDFQPDTPGFLFPVRFRLEAAEKPDFSDARVVFERTQKDEPNPGTNAPEYRFAPATARYVRLAVTRLARRDATNHAFALAELELMHGETNLAAGAKVPALDSIETGAWAKVNLTDGVTTTIKPGGAESGALPAALLRKAFALDRPLVRATAYVSALGLYEFRLNGRRVGNHLLAPEWTSYRQRVQYQVYDVTGLLHSGENAAAAWLGEGWYAGRLMAVGRFAYGNCPRFLLQLELEFTDGHTTTLVSDGSWRATTDGPLRSAGIYDGELYDARREFPGWDSPGFNDAAWPPADPANLPTPQLVWQRNEPITVEQELKPLRVTTPKPGTFIFDFGQNLVGWCRLQGTGVEGQPVTLRHAEMLNDDSTIYTANLRGAPQVDRYLPRADGSFTYEPRFTYHGFRYLEVSGLAQPPTAASATARVFHSASPPAGSFECSDPSLNQLMRNILWTQRANLMSSPNDCPQRDERFGWMGDIQAFSQTAIFNLDMAAFLTKFAQDIRDDQADDGRFPDFAPHPGNPNQTFSGVPAWGDAGVIVPWRGFQNYGDTRLLAEHFEAARRWVDYIHRNNPDLVWAKGRNNDYNDWLNGDWVKQPGWPAQGGSTPNAVFATAFFAHSTDLVARMAEVLGRAEEARRYRELFQRIKAVFNENFVQPDGSIEGDTQGGCALALDFDLVPAELRPQVTEHLVANIHRYHDHLSTGIQTTHRAMLALAREGQAPLAWQLLTNRTFPSWLYMIDNGATTIWERWDGYVKGRGFQDAGMNSFNHWAFGAVGEWLWRNVAGLNPDDVNPGRKHDSRVGQASSRPASAEPHPGWKHFTVAPEPGGGITWARATYDSIHGPIVSEWKIEGTRFTLRVSVPPNTSAAIIIPGAKPEAVTESGKPAATAPGVKPAQVQAGRAAFEVGAGDYEFTAPL